MRAVDLNHARQRAAVLKKSPGASRRARPVRGKGEGFNAVLAVAGNKRCRVLILVQLGNVDVLVTHLHGCGVQAIEKLEGLALRLNAGLQRKMVGAGLLHGRLIVLQLGGVVAGLDLLILGVGF